MLLLASEHLLRFEMSFSANSVGPSRRFKINININSSSWNREPNSKISSLVNEPVTLTTLPTVIVFSVSSPTFRLVTEKPTEASSFGSMGCVSSNLLNHEDEFSQLGSSALGHHIVSLTSTTYGLLNLDPPPSTPPSRFTFGSIFPSPLSEPRPLRSEPEVINSWELMAGLDADSFRFSPLPLPKPFTVKDPSFNKENSNPNGLNLPIPKEARVLKPSREEIKKPGPINPALDRFVKICPPNGDDRVVIYTTTLRGVRKTFEDCNEVRRAIEGLGVVICERDVSMDCGFKEELKELLKGKGREGIVPPRVFVKGRYIGGAEEVLRLAEEGLLGKILEGLPRKKEGVVCEGCGDMRFLPCFHCHGSCKMVMVVKEKGRTVVVRCPDCNENGLVLCPICC